MNENNEKNQKIFNEIEILKNKWEINGCGGKWSFIKPPYSSFFIASCEIHDYNYFKGWNEEDRKYADKWFLKYMLIDINMYKDWYKRVYFILWAYMYYIAVRIFWKKYFNYNK